MTGMRIAHQELDAAGHGVQGTAATMHGDLAAFQAPRRQGACLAGDLSRQRRRQPTANGHVQSALSSNQSQGIEMMNASWSQKDAAHRNLTSGGTGAALVGAGLQICAAVVLMFKTNVIIHLVNLVIEIAQSVAEAVGTFGASLLEIPVFKEFTQKAIGLIQNTAINSVLASA